MLVARRTTETHAETDATVPEATESESELATEPQMVTTTVLPTSRVLFGGPDVALPQHGDANGDGVLCHGDESVQDSERSGSRARISERLTWPSWSME